MMGVTTNGALEGFEVGTGVGAGVGKVGLLSVAPVALVLVHQRPVDSPYFIELSVV